MLQDACWEGSVRCRRIASYGAHELTRSARQDAVTVQACQVVHALIQSLVGLVFLVVLRCGCAPRCVQAAHVRAAALCRALCRAVRACLLAFLSSRAPSPCSSRIAPRVCAGPVAADLAGLAQQLEAVAGRPRYLARHCLAHARAIHRRPELFAVCTMIGSLSHSMSCAWLVWCDGGWRTRWYVGWIIRRGGLLVGVVPYRRLYATIL